MILCIGAEEEEVIIVEIEEAEIQETEVEEEEVAAMPVIVIIKMLVAISAKIWNISNRNILDMDIESAIQIIEM